jgi:hypothetical protein
VNDLKKLMGFCLLVLVLCLAPAGASAVTGIVRDGPVGEIPGFRFGNLVYGWGSVFVDVVNMTDRSRLFGGTMVFLDRYGRPVASARLLPQKIPGNSGKRCTGHFVAGTGETARRADRVLWDFGPR